MPDELLLLDTDIVSLMGRRRPPPGLRPWLLRLGASRLGISFPVITELERGAHLVKATDPARAREIRTWIDQILQTDFKFLEMSFDVASVYAEMTTTPCLRHMWTVQRKEKSNRLGHDLMIASVAVAYAVPIVSCNIRDYLAINEKFPLPGLYQPLEGVWYVPPMRTTILPPLDPGESEPHEAALPKLRNPETYMSAGLTGDPAP